MSVEGPAEAAVPERSPCWFAVAVASFALGVAHLAFHLTGLWVGVYTKLPEPLFRWLREPAGAPRMMRVHRMWWGLAVAALVLSGVRRERVAPWARVGLVTLVLLSWLLWEFVLRAMGTF